MILIFNKRNQKLFTAAIMAVLFLTLTGCSDLAEVQDRDFVLALGASFKDGKYELTFGLPDLSVLTKGGKDGGDEEESGRARSYKSASLAEIEDLYNHGSNKRLDYRHLEALILDESISKSPDNLFSLFEYMDDNYQISRDVLIFYYSGDVKKLIEEKGKIKGGIGNYLKKLEKNNQRKNGLSPVTIGNLIDSLTQEKDVLVPIVEMKEDKIEVNGGAVFQNSVLRKKLNSEELKVYYVIKGKGKEYNFHTKSEFVFNELVFKLKELKSKLTYQFKNNKPTIHISISGTAEELSKKQDGADLEHEINSYLTEAITTQIDACFKSERLDYLNLYSGSALYNRDMWLYYQNRMDDFINDTCVTVNTDIKIK